MKAISLHQPWAVWVFMGWKTIETRTHARFKGLAGQRIAIHAAQKIDEAALFELAKYRRLGPLEIQNLCGFIAMTRGKIICSVAVDRANWAPYPGSAELSLLEKLAMCDVTGKYLLELKDRILLAEGLPYKGGRGIFNVPDELIATQHQYRPPEVKA